MAEYVRRHILEGGVPLPRIFHYKLEPMSSDLPTFARSEGTNITEVLYSNPIRDTHELLLDVLVWDRRDGEGVTLAVESEWLQNVKDVADDFWKLLVLRLPSS